jgi:hypothetical protein
MLQSRREIVHQGGSERQWKTLQLTKVGNHFCHKNFISTGTYN